MNIVDVIKCEVNDKELVYKFSSESIRLGSQLIVYPAQTAFFVKGGKILDEFSSGTYTIKSENIPLLGKLISLPFDGKSPFAAEVWFINQIAILDCKWGTPNPIQIEDPKYNIIVPVRACGQYGFKITQPRKFLENFVGNMTSFTVDKLTTYFRGIILSRLTNVLSDKLTSDNISIINIHSHLNAISDYCQVHIGAKFEEYGICIENFNVISITVPENDKSFLRLKEAKDFAARLQIMGKDVYQMERSFDVLETAAANEGSGMIGMGVGIGAGLNIGNQVGTMATAYLNTNMQPAAAPPPLVVNREYHVAINGKQQRGYNLDTLKNDIANGKIQENTLVWTQGLANWVAISQLPEFEGMFTNCPPPLPNV